MGRVPRRTGESSAFALSPEEEHLLASIDDSLDERELAFVAGMSEEQVGEMLERLAMLGVVSLAVRESDRDAHLPPVAHADGIQLDAEERDEIDHLYEALASADYYMLLGLTRQARPKEIKKSYYRLAPRYHPDKHFGKELGPYKGRIEAIFGALTRAHDTLRFPKRRVDYDAALAPLRPEDADRSAIHPLHIFNPEVDLADRPTIAPEDGGRASQRPTMRPESPAARRSEVGQPPEAGPAEGGPAEGGPAEAGQPLEGGPAEAGPLEAGRLEAGRLEAGPLEAGQGQSQAHQTPPPARSSAPSNEGGTAEARSSRPPGRSSLRSTSDSLSPEDTGVTRTVPPRRRRRWRARPSGSTTDALRDPEAERVQKDVLARKLAGNKLKSRRQSGRYASDARVSQLDTGTFKGAEDVRKSAAEMFRDRYEQLADSAKKRRLEKYLEQAETAMESGDYRMAVAAFQQASKLSPDDADLAEKLETATALATQD